MQTMNDELTDKTNYLMRCFRHTHNKDRENYVVLGIWHRLRTSDIKCDLQPITQQYVKRAEGGYALLDLYFPAIKLAVECDEAFHKKNYNSDQDRENDVFQAFHRCGIGDSRKRILRLDKVMTSEHAAEQAINADMVDVGNLEIARVDASLSYIDIDEQLDFIVEKIKLRFQKAGQPRWDIRPAEDIVLENGRVKDNEILVFNDIASVLKGLNILKGDGMPYPYWGRGGFPIGESRILWFPHLSFVAGGWHNILSENGDEISESRGTGHSVTDEKQRRIAQRDWAPDVEKMRNGGTVERCVFAHSKNALGERGYRFLGIYKLVDAIINTEDKMPEKLEFRKTQHEMSILPDGATYYKG